MKQISPKNIDEYISQFPESTAKMLKEIRLIIKGLAPKAQEAIKYGMPTFVLNGNLVHFAGYNKHLGFYPTPSAIIAFEKELKKYQYSKGAVQFPLNEPLPKNLITKMVKFRIKENEKKQ